MHTIYIAGLLYNDCVGIMSSILASSRLAIGLCSVHRINAVINASSVKFNEHTKQCKCTNLLNINSNNDAYVVRTMRSM